MVRQMPPMVGAWYKDSMEALAALRELEASGIPVSQISVVGRGVRLHDDLQKYFNPAADMGQGILKGLGIGGVLGLLFGVFLGMMPDIQRLIPFWSPVTSFFMLLALTIVGAEMGGFVMGIYALGLSGEDSARYQGRILSGLFLVSVHGTPEEMERARLIFEATGILETSDHEKSMA